MICKLDDLISIRIQVTRRCHSPATARCINKIAYCFDFEIRHVGTCNEDGIASMSCVHASPFISSLNKNDSKLESTTDYFCNRKLIREIIISIKRIYSPQSIIIQPSFQLDCKFSLNDTSFHRFFTIVYTAKKRNIEI